MDVKIAYFLPIRAGVNAKRAGHAGDPQSIHST